MNSRRKMSVAVGILLVKDRIQQFYQRCAAEERTLNDFKRKHSYCTGRPFCMNQVADDKTSCRECLKANANPTYTKKQSEYGRMRAQEKAKERRVKGKVPTLVAHGINDVLTVKGRRTGRKAA